MEPSECLKYTKDKIINLVFRPSDNFKVNWDLLIMILSLYNSFTVPVEMSFNPAGLQYPIMKRINNAIDLIFFLDILIAFRTVYHDEYGIEIMDAKIMALNYIKSSFLFDVLATVPLDDTLLLFKSYRMYV